jgi:hypothetical protein
VPGSAVFGVVQAVITKGEISCLPTDFRIPRTAVTRSAWARIEQLGGLDEFVAVPGT